MESVQRRFEANIDKGGANGCWLWTGSRNAKGYGDGGRRLPKLAHRGAWTLYRGPIPDGAHVLHRCDNPPCVNPEHLFLGTHVDNMRDAAVKGRMTRGEARPTAKLTEQQVRDIRAARADGRTQASVADQYGVSRGCISNIDQRQTWCHVA